MTISLTLTNKIIDKYSLLHSESGISNSYDEAFNQMGGAISFVADNDLMSNINVAIANFSPTEEQTIVLIEIGTILKDIETRIDPERLKFNITKAFDDEICLNKVSSQGLTKIIIHEDGMIAISFVSSGKSKKESYLKFIEGEVDYEALAFEFLS